MHMLRSLSIQGFRAFDRLRLDGLGRVNLVVGTNNCGKTSVLEAVSLVAGAPSLRPLLEAQAARGELLEEPSLQVDVAQLIHGRTLRVGAGFQIDARTHDGKTVAFDASVVARTADIDKPEYQQVFDLYNSDEIREFITGWNHRKHPFIWTKPADQVLAKIERKRKNVSTTSH